jgi:hypothetical protein
MGIRTAMRRSFLKVNAAVAEEKAYQSDRVFTLLVQVETDLNDRS